MQEGEPVYFELDALSENARYKLLVGTVVPRPIALVVTRDRRGVLNAAPFSWFNTVSSEPPVVVLGIASRLVEERKHGGAEQKDTLANIRDTGEFVVNLVSEAIAAQTNITEGDFPPEEDEVAIAGLRTAASSKVGPPRIADSPVSIECTTMQIVPLSDTSAIVLGRALAMHIADDCMLDPERHYVDTPKLGLVGRMHAAGWYARTSDLFHLGKVDMQRPAPGR
ncbi:flavin reductase family protein [Mesorhizobium sp. M1233]|uniref:flavin reductase family protein n=1 Tax=Mesorhizobium sp. M1233 TaxID=2957072 RepID=UPI003338FB18